MPSPRARAIRAGLWPIATRARSRSLAPDTDTADAAAGCVVLAGRQRRGHDPASSWAAAARTCCRNRSRSGSLAGAAAGPHAGAGLRLSVVLGDPAQRRVIRRETGLGQAAGYDLGEGLAGGLGGPPRADARARCSSSWGAMDGSAARARASRRSAWL